MVSVSNTLGTRVFPGGDNKKSAPWVVEKQCTEEEKERKKYVLDNTYFYLWPAMLANATTCGTCNVYCIGCPWPYMSLLVTLFLFLTTLLVSTINLSSPGLH